ncbi:MAG: ATP-dependent 6-phosphofructokinase [Clostridia bacterium]|nr:ATP-dependent 6-phosphofructokinase [Clostridia bacterium]MDD4048382.1 ATP-dependent 6-phosphofructokinase [Clostridia bacterium]
MKIKKIGVLTGGGDAPGLNGVIRSVVLTAINDYDIEVVGFEDGFSGLIRNKYRVLERESVSEILHRGGTILGTSNRDNPFHFPVRSNGQVTYQDVSDEGVSNLKKLGVDVLIVIGGDGSLRIAKEFSDKGIKIVGVPKTIDNDLGATDVTFGFNTAVTTATEALDKLRTTVESHHGIMVLEVMGRYGGWIALHAGLAGGADVILIPEIPYDLEKVKEKIEKRKSQGKLSSIVVVAEGATPVNGKYTVDKMMEGRTEPIKLGGIGQVVAQQLVELTGLEARVTVLGYLQRGGSPTSCDRILSTRFGVMAVKQAVEGPWTTMVALHGQSVVTVSLDEAIKQLKKVDCKGELVEVARAIGVNFGK